MSMKAIGKNIIIDEVMEEVRSVSGLLLSAKDADGFRYRRGVVVSPGTDVVCISSGDEIYFDKSHSYTMLINERPYTIIQERDVVVVLSPR